MAGPRQGSLYECLWFQGTEYIDVQDPVMTKYDITHTP